MERMDTELRRILEDEGRSQAWLSRRLGVSRQAVGMWVHGIYTPVPETREAIASALRRSVDELWPGHGTASSPDGTNSGALDRNAA